MPFGNIRHLKLNTKKATLEIGHKNYAHKMSLELFERNSPKMVEIRPSKNYAHQMPVESDAEFLNKKSS